MEIEAKFSVPAKEIFSLLMSVSSIKPFTLGASVQAHLEDTYLDTVDMAIMSEGYYLRRRQKGQCITYTIKSLGGTGKKGIRQREEMECVLEQDMPFEKWDNEDMKVFLKSIVSKSELVPLFNVSHIRNMREIIDEERHVAELSLDDVVINGWGKRLSYLEIEAELLVDGNKEDLEKLMSVLGKEYGLITDSLSKFERGLQLIEEAEEPDPLLEEGTTILLIPLSFQTLFEKYHVERAHARKVTENALKLFDELKEVHGLGDEYRRVIWIASLVHDVGVYTDLEDHHKAGRDILMHFPPKELPPEFWPVAVWTTFLHKKKVTKDKLDKLQSKSFGKLPVGMQQDTLKLAALIRIADGLDYSRMGSRLERITIEDKKVTILVQGQSSRIDADRADEKSDLWRILYSNEISFQAEG
ncbi:CYTH domain-containing protein [uncultured Methanomethylovorans sp.]|uniref:CYTH domain-containing protein n=1 Tax=uncultured Methanomethylovorans sp. TaxID=183759 RepID=UPI002AA78A3B|nr:CYTH domain-containing protein [uncultured Methanomethylovorans sp.]